MDHRLSSKKGNKKVLWKYTTSNSKGDAFSEDGTPELGSKICRPRRVGSCSNVQSGEQKLVSFIQPAFIKYSVLVNMEMESLHQSHSRKDLLTQLSALMGLISSEENLMTRFSYSLEQPTSKDRLWWGRKSQPANREQ